MADVEGGRLSDGKGLGSGREEAGDGPVTFEPVLRGPSGLSGRGRNNSVSQGGSCDAVVLREVSWLRGGCGCRWVGGEMRQALGRLNLFRAG